jgi:diguanylate cyclase (GGDEF)-like protein/PAS domain S-box-containing protein
MTNILVVDDNAPNRKAIFTLLQHEGYTPVEATDGADGLRVAELNRPQLIISDILMPSMDGYEFVRQLRSNPALAQTAVIFYTANYHKREATALAEQCGVARVIMKPCGAKEFLSAVADVLAGAPIPSSPPNHRDFERNHMRVLTDELSAKADQLSELNSRFVALTELNVQLASERDPSVLLERVCTGARNLLGAKYAVLAIADRKNPNPPRVWTSGIDLKTGPTPAFPIDKGLPGQAYLKCQTLRASRSQNASVDFGPLSHFPPAISALAAPIQSLTRTYGWIYLADKLGTEEFDANDESMLGTLGAQVGRIYENGSLYLEVQQHATQLLVEMEERERAAVQLRNSELRFRQLAENIEDVFFIATPDLSESIYISPAFERIWGRPSSELLDHPRRWIEMISPADRERAVRSRESAARNWPAQSEIEFRIIRPDGQTRWILERLFPIMDDAGIALRAVGIDTDITERKEAEAKIVQLSRVHSMLSGINALIVRVSDRDELFREACRLAVDEGGFRVAWCALLDSATGQVRPVASKGDLPEIHELLSPTIGDCPADDNIVTAALRSHRAEICNNLEADSPGLRGHEQLIEQGFRGLGVFPLLASEHSIGCLVLMTNEIGLFDAAETRLLVQLAGDISFALDHIDKVERLNYLAYYDSLTGLANRTFLGERVAIHAGAAARRDGRFALVSVGPERFEGFRESLGRSTGDDLLRRVAERLVETVGSSDLVAHLGSDQFAVIIPDLQSDYSVQNTIERWWREWLGPTFKVDDQELTLSAKAGIALYPADGTDADTLLRNAQAALKKAKDSPSKHVFYTPNLSEKFAERVTLENQMRRALEHEEFVLHYQPKVDMGERRLVGVEALLRWQNPQLGLIPPSTFIPIMEENGLIVEVGSWVMRQACQDRSRWLERGLKAPRIAVNVSALQLRQDDFVRTVSSILKLAGSEAGIDFEVTESLLMENVNDNIKKLSAVRELGVQIALDDFGTGYSSLSYLARLPVKTLKIDRSFVISMLDDPSATALVSTIISLARTLRLETVAEGVESEEQAKILRLLQCDQMQGYLISKPLSFDDMTTFLERTRS